MDKAERQEAADTLRLLVERIDRGGPLCLIFAMSASRETFVRPRSTPWLERADALGNLGSRPETAS